MSVTPRTRPGLAVGVGIGLLAGALSGLFGVGGGILIVPGLVLLTGMGQRRAHATSLAAILPIAIAGAAGYGLEGAIDWIAVGLLTAGGIVGSFLGTHALRRIPERSLRILFALFLLVAAALLPFEATAGAGAAIDLVRGIALVLVGALAGALAGLLGVGGGIVMVPGLVLLASLSPAVAKGTSLVAIIPTSLVGTLRNVERNDVDLPTSATIGAGGVVASFAASLLSVRLDPELSAILFGALLVVMAVRLLLAARGKPIPGEHPD
ncbi:MAG: sulfite exporter TauE/SafE family protein [Actinomycetota bacterium]|nr:sulfite exporter TauE/SafE family protein [Actinomycetota bacterium]